jgi:hypothetical protein
MKRAFLYLLILSISAFAYPIGGPSISPEKGKFIGSILYTRDARNIRGLRIHSNRLLARVCYGVSYWLDIYPLFGTTDMNFPPASSYISEFNGSWELAYGGGLRIHYLDWMLRTQTPQYVRSYVNLFYFTYLSRDTVSEGHMRYWKVKYEMREYGIGVYWGYQWHSFIFYGGGEYTYLNGRVWWEAYSSRWTQIFKSSSFFNDPAQTPRPILGLDILFPINLVLTLELRPWYNKDKVAFTVSLSQKGALRKSTPETEK